MALETEEQARELCEAAGLEVISYKEADHVLFTKTEPLPAEPVRNLDRLLKSNPDTCNS